MYSGWGRYPVQAGTLTEPPDPATLEQLLQSGRLVEGGGIPRGAGRSYGDSALGSHMLGSRFLDHYLAFDRSAGEITCAAGVRLAELLQLVMAAGWMLPVLPGTGAVTVAGAIASDVHGKNHHRDGCFSNFITSLTLLLPSGERIRVSQGENSELFHATCGGMGLTGFILDATLKLVPLTGRCIRQRRLIARDLDQILDLFEEHDDSHYSAAWLDCLSQGKALGRSVLFLGEHAAAAGKSPARGLSLTVPFTPPGVLLNRITIGVFNELVFRRQQAAAAESVVDLHRFFFPLDRVAHWNRLYGRRGFLQYQLVIPTAGARQGLQQVLQAISATGKGSFLTVLKKMGPQNSNLLSFPLAGYTLALDFRYQPDLFQLLDQLDSIVLEHGGRLYLAKDARMSEHVFRAGYPRWQQFRQLRQQIDPNGRFASAQSRRLGL